MPGQTIKLYIAGDELKNLKTAELSQWTGKAYIGERKHTKLIQKINDLHVPGIYILLSEENESNLLKRIYIGEADEVNKRINNHYSQKDWWEKFVIFISKDTNLTKAHVRYLEKALYNIARENITTIDLENNSEPAGSKLPVSDEDDMEIFKANVIFILRNLGIIDLTRYDKKTPGRTEFRETFFINLTSDRIDKNGEVLKGQLSIEANSYKLLAGSFIEGKERKSFSAHAYYPLRKKIESDGLFDTTEYEDIYVLIRDVEFSSASAAASIVKNRATNGRKEWKLADGTTLDDYENNLQANE